MNDLRDRGETNREGGVVLDGVSVDYVTVDGVTRALEDVNLAVEETFVAIVGPSGCGKSTLLSLVAGLVAPATGGVTVDAEQVKGPLRRVGYMLQEDKRIASFRGLTSSRT